MGNYVNYKPFGVIEQPVLAFDPRFGQDSKPLPLIEREYNEEGKLIKSTPRLENVDLNSITITDKVNLLRDDTFGVIGTVGTNYNVVPHRDIFDGIRKGFDDNNVKVDYEKSRMLMDQRGSKLWMHFILDGKEFGEDIDGTGYTTPQMIIKHALDGTGSLNGTIGHYQFVCENGIVRGENLHESKYYHNSSLDLNGFTDAVMNAVEGSKKDLDFYKSLMGHEVLDDEISKWLENRLKRKGDDISTIDVDENGDPIRYTIGNHDIENTIELWKNRTTGTKNRREPNLWSVLNTVTEVISHKNVSPDTIVKQLQHASNRIECLFNNYDAEIALAHAA